jgi:hypothetical protein
MPKVKREKVMFIYMDRGYMIGLPARDMDEDEWVTYPKELTKAALVQKLYVVINPESKEVKDA